MRRKDKAYIWWKGRPSSVRKPLVLTLGGLLVIVSPFTGVLPGPGGIPIFLLGVAILASEYQWAERFKRFMLTIVPEWIKRYWRLTPKWLYFFDIIALLIFGTAIVLLYWPIRLPVIGMTASPPFFELIADQQQEWWIPAAICFAAAGSIFLLNRNRVEWIKKQLRKLKG